MDSIKIKGQVQLTLKSESGETKSSVQIHNLVVTAGKEFIASRLASGSASVISHMALGTDTTTPSVGNTALGAEAIRVGLVTAGGTAAGTTITFDATFPPGSGTGSITEAGLFNGATGSTMLARTSFAAVPKDVTDTLDISWVVTIL